MKKSIPTIWERESDAIIPGNSWERKREWNEEKEQNDMMML